MEKEKLQKTKKQYLLLIVVCVFAFSVSGVKAAEIYFGTASEGVGLEKPFEVGVFLNTEAEPINAVEGTVVFPTDSLELLDIRDAGSVLTLWIERPHLTQGAQTSEVSFAGVVPGGYFGREAYLFSLVFQAKQTASVTIGTLDERVLLNDGKGTEATLQRAPLVLNIKEVSEIPEYLPPYDTEPPEPFVFEVTRDPNVFDNKWFVVFATQDKISGIDHYEILEEEQKGSFRRLFGKRTWRIGESPYLLQDQTLKSYITVKAIDRAGNERIASVLPQNPLEWYENYFIWAIIIIGIGGILIASVFLRIVWRKHKK